MIPVIALTFFGVAWLLQKVAEQLPTFGAARPAAPTGMTGQDRMGGTE